MLESRIETQIADSLGQAKFNGNGLKFNCKKCFFFFISYPKLLQSIPQWQRNLFSSKNILQAVNVCCQLANNPFIQSFIHAFILAENPRLGILASPSQFRKTALHIDIIILPETTNCQTKQLLSNLLQWAYQWYGKEKMELSKFLWQAKKQFQHINKFLTIPEDTANEKYKKKRKKKYGNVTYRNERKQMPGNTFSINLLQLSAKQCHCHDALTEVLCPVAHLRAEILTLF